MNPAVFRAYDVRGVAARDLDDAFVTALGRAYGTVIRRAGGRVVTVGRDCRLSGPRLHAALTAGILSTGVDIVDIGVVPSPLLYFSVHHLGTDGGVEITGSHNPKEYNGFKLMRGTSTLHGPDIQHLRALIEADDFEHGAGTTRDEDVVGAYVDVVAAGIQLGPHKQRVVVDGGHGTGGPIAARLLERMGVEFISLNEPMDGNFPGHHPDPTVEANLQEVKDAVREHQATVGIAYDGDADRIGVVDDAGQVIWGDKLMILLARSVLAAHPGAAIVGEVKCSTTLYDDITARGGRAIMSQVGHSIIKDRMKREGALLAGEMSGHIFFADRWYGFDDAIYVSARVIEILSHAEAPLSELLADVPETFVTPEIRVDCPDDRKFDLVAQAVAHYKTRHDVVDIDGARVDFGTGWGLIRASNTQPVLVLRAEADTAAHLAAIRAELEGFVATNRGA